MEMVYNGLCRTYVLVPLYTAHQPLTSQTDDFFPALALTQGYENVRQVVRGLNELNQNIRRYTERVTRDMDVADLLRLQYDDYAQILGPAYHALKTSDHVSRYRRDITGRLQVWQLDGDWLDATADELATQGRLTPAQAADEVNHYLRFIINQQPDRNSFYTPHRQRPALYGRKQAASPPGHSPRQGRRLAASRGLRADCRPQKQPRLRD
jgi:hypothetical protein